jgi:four helix bundle protein
MSTLNESANPAYKPQLKSTLFDHERLEVYKLELDFIKWVTPLIDEAAKSATGRPREACDQLDRASLSSLLNTAEGNGKRQRQVRARFFDDARGSATECAGCLDALVAKGVLPAERIMDGKAMLLRIVCMLSGLVDRFDEPTGRLREDVVEYGSASLADSSTPGWHNQEETSTYRISRTLKPRPRQRRRQRQRRITSNP